MLFWTILLVLLTIIFTGSTLEKIEKPNMIIEDLTSARQYTFMMNQTVEVQFPSLFSAYEGKVYDRVSGYNYINFGEDFKQHNEQYQTSQNCYFQPAYLELDTQYETFQITGQKILNHAVDWANRCSYLLTNDLTVLKNCKKEQSESYLLDEDSQMLQLGKLNSTGILHFNYQNQKLYVFLHNGLLVYNGSSFLKVDGYFQTEFGGDFIFRKDQLLILRPQSSIIIYNITSLTQFMLVNNIKNWKTTNISPIDFKFINDQLWVLDSSYGFYTYNMKTVEPSNSYLIRYGKKLFFEVQQNITFQIAFELNGDTFVAEMIMINDTMVLNRFYDQINGVKQLLFLGQRLAIIGQEQMMTIQHSTNAALLGSHWQDKSFYPMFGLLQIQPKIHDVKQQDIFFSMINGKNITVVKYKRNHPILTCLFTNLSKTDINTIYIQFNSTLCKKNQRPSMSTSYCNIQYNLNYRTVGVVSSLLDLILTVLIILIATIIFFCMLISAKKMKQRKRQQIEALQAELKKRMQQKSSKQASQAALHQNV